MPKKFLSLLTYLLTLGLGIFLVWLSLRNLTAEESEKIRFAVSKARFPLLIPILLMGFISHWSRAVRWKYLMEPLGLKPSTANALFAVMIGYLANLAFPRLGEVLKCTLLARYEKVPADKLVGTIIAERAFDLLCLIIIFLLTFLVQIDFANGLLSDLRTKNAAAGSGTGSNYWLWGAVLGIGLLIWIFRGRIMAVKAFRRVREIMKNVLSGIMSFRTMQHKGGFVFHTVLIWSMYLGMIMLGFQSIAGTNHLGLNASLSVLSFGSVGMILTPGGLGAYTGLVEQIVGLYGIEKAISIAISWIIWLVPTGIIVLGGGLSLLLLPLFNRNTHAKQA